MKELEKEIIKIVSCCLLCGMVGYGLGIATVMPTAREAAENKYNMAAVPLYERYYQANESLLDSIAVNSSDFNDTFGETDEYADYLAAKHAVDSVLYDE